MHPFVIPVYRHALFISTISYDGPAVELHKQKYSRFTCFKIVKSGGHPIYMY